MSEQKDANAVDRALRDYFTAAAPRPEFLARLESDLQSAPPQRLPTRRGTWRWSVALLTGAMLLLLVVALAGPRQVWAAIQKWAGFAPGYGLVAEDSALRVLAQPVTQTRQGVTLTVQEALLSAQRTSLSFTVQGLPAGAIPQGVVEEKDRLCSPTSVLRLPDGRELPGAGSGGYRGQTYTWDFSFPPVPAEVAQAQWRLDCLPQTLTGQAPANWEIDLRFAAAPANLALLPVDVLPQPSATADNPVVLDQVVETADGYLFLGRFRQVLPAPVGDIMPQLLDGRGLPVGFTIPNDVLTSRSDSEIGWAYQVRQKQISWPLTIRFADVDVYCDDPLAAASFDTGANPPVGQRWEIEKDLFSGPCRVRLARIEREARGYSFYFPDEGHITSLFPTIAGAEGKESGSDHRGGHLNVTLLFAGEAPTGRLTVTFSGAAKFSGPWQVQWQPGK